MWIFVSMSAFRCHRNRLPLIAVPVAFHRNSFDLLFSLCFRFFFAKICLSILCQVIKFGFFSSFFLQWCLSFFFVSYTFNSEYVRVPIDILQHVGWNESKTHTFTTFTVFLRQNSLSFGNFICELLSFFYDWLPLWFSYSNINSTCHSIKPNWMGE